MARTKGLMYTCYALLPLFSVFVILAVSWLLAAFIEIYSNNLTMLNTLNRFTQHTAAGNNKLAADPPFPGKTLDNTFWFVQISDIHISKYRSYGQEKDLELFCSNWLPIIKPSLALVTGDLTDAKDRVMIGSSQYEEEWVKYSSLMKKCTSNGGTQWLDIRGNHDAFGVQDLSDPNNMFETYGLSRKKYKDGVHHYVYDTGFGKYVFNGIDMAPSPGPGRPFNFFGMAHEKMLSLIERISAKNFNATVWFGHYPLSVTTNPHELRKLLALSGVAYLCGHLHTMLGLIPQMHVVHSEGLLELELGDWKMSRTFRIGVFDHDVFSFVDVIYSQDPIVIFTNPIDARYIIPGKIPFTKSWNSTHIRILVFQFRPITNAKVFINGALICSNTEVIKNVLHVCEWNPLLYLNGVHQLTFILIDNDRTSRTFKNTFSLDGTRPPLSLRSVILILTDFCTMLRMIFIACTILTIIIPILLKKYKNTFYIGLLRRLVQRMLPQLVWFLDCDRVFWPLFYYNCYLCVGPFSVGHFVPEQIGFAFSFGIYTGGRFIDGTITFLYVSIQLLFFNSIMMVYVGEIIQSKANTIGPIHPSCVRRTFFKAILVLLFCVETYCMCMYWISYGMMASLSNILSTWSMPLAVYLIRQASKPDSCRVIRD